MLRFLLLTCLFILFRIRATKRCKARRTTQIIRSRIRLRRQRATLRVTPVETLPAILLVIPVGILPVILLVIPVGILPGTPAETLPDPKVASSLTPIQTTTLRKNTTDHCWAKKILISKTHRAVALGKLTFPRAAALLLAFHQESLLRHYWRSFLSDLIHREVTILIFGGDFQVGHSTKNLIIWSFGGAFWKCYSTKKPLRGLVGGACQLFCSTEKSMKSIVGGTDQLFCSTEKLLKSIVGGNCQLNCPTKNLIP